MSNYIKMNGKTSIALSLFLFLYLSLVSPKQGRENGRCTHAHTPDGEVAAGPAIEARCIKHVFVPAVAIPSHHIAIAIARE